MNLMFVFELCKTMMHIHKENLFMKYSVNNNAFYISNYIPIKTMTIVIVNQLEDFELRQYLKCTFTNFIRILSSYLNEKFQVSLRVFKPTEIP